MLLSTRAHVLIFLLLTLTPKRYVCKLYKRLQTNKSKLRIYYSYCGQIKIKYSVGFYYILRIKWQILITFSESNSFLWMSWLLSEEELMVKANLKCLNFELFVARMVDCDLLCWHALCFTDSLHSGTTVKATFCTLFKSSNIIMRYWYEISMLSNHIINVKTSSSKVEVSTKLHMSFCVFLCLMCC